MPAHAYRRCVRWQSCDTAVNAIDYAGSSRLLASGHTDRTVRVHDPRATHGSALVHTLRKHRGFVSGVSWSPVAEHLLASVSFDHAVCLWDLRACENGPLHTVSAHSDRGLCVKWVTADRVASGGADSALRVLSLAAQSRARTGKADAAESSTGKSQSAAKRGAASASTDASAADAVAAESSAASSSAGKRAKAAARKR